MNFTIDLLRTSANVRNSLTRIKTITGIAIQKNKSEK